jgi:cytochrome c oxidase subunit IV
MSDRIISTASYAAVFALLLGLLALTVAAAHLPLGEWSVVTALSIAAAKAVLIGLYFMHLRHADNLVRVFSLAGLFWLLLLMTLVMADYVTRPDLGSAF